MEIGRVPWSRPRSREEKGHCARRWAASQRVATFCARLNEKSSRIYYFRVLPLASVNIWPFGHGVAMQIGRDSSSHCCRPIIYDLPGLAPPSSRRLSSSIPIVLPFPRSPSLSAMHPALHAHERAVGVYRSGAIVGATPAAIIVRSRQKANFSHFSRAPPSRGGRHCGLGRERSSRRFRRGVAEAAR